MSIESKAHDLTILFMSQTTNMKDVVTPEDYVAKYNEIRERIETALGNDGSESVGMMMPEVN